MSTENENALLSAMVGAFQLTEDQVKGFNEKPETFNEFFQGFVTKTKTEFRDTLAGDADFTKAFYDKGYQEAHGKFANMPREQLKTEFGLTAEEVTGKNIREISEIIRGKLNSGKSKDKTELEDAITRLNTQLAEAEAAKTEELQSLQANFESKWKQRERTDMIRGIAEKNPLLVPPTAAIPYLETVLNGYQLGENDALLTSEGGNVWMDDAKTKPFKTSDFIAAKLKEANMLKTEEKPPKPGDGQPITTTTINGGQPITRKLNPVQQAALNKTAQYRQQKQ